MPGYPDKEFYLSWYQKYLFRPEALLPLRAEQVNRYFAPSAEGGRAHSLEDTLTDSDDEPPPPEEGHRH